MEARTVTAPPPAAEPDTAAPEPLSPAPTFDTDRGPTARASRVAARRRTPRATGARPAARPIVLTRDEEYQIIRTDLRRLLVTGGSLLVLMVALLIVLGL